MLIDKETLVFLCFFDSFELRHKLLSNWPPIDSFATRLPLVAVCLINQLANFLFDPWKKNPSSHWKPPRNLTKIPPPNSSHKSRSLSDRRGVWVMCNICPTQFGSASNANRVQINKNRLLTMLTTWPTIRKSTRKKNTTKEKQINKISKRKRKDFHCTWRAFTAWVCHGLSGGGCGRGLVCAPFIASWPT